MEAPSNRSAAADQPSPDPGPQPETRKAVPRQFLFIVTYGRSGSTLLMKLVGAIDGYHIAGENTNTVLGLCQSYLAVQETKQKFGRAPKGRDDPWFGAHLVRPNAFAKRLVNVFVDEVLRPPPEARVIGFKEIRYYEKPEFFRPQLEFMSTFFTPAKFVFNVRNIDEVAKSGWWKDRSHEAVTRYITSFHREMEAFMAAHPEQCFKVDYNEYTHDPASLSLLYEFLGEPFDLDNVTGVLSEKLTH